jgi:hypothetical protein
MQIKRDANGDFIPRPLSDLKEQLALRIIMAFGQALRVTSPEGVASATTLSTGSQSYFSQASRNPAISVLVPA